MLLTSILASSAVSSHSLDIIEEEELTHFDSNKQDAVEKAVLSLAHTSFGLLGNQVSP